MKKKIYKVGFVILHYQLIEMTKVCVECLLTNFSEYNISIIIVDNASPNGTGKELQRFYKENEKVTVICNDNNDGFSKGNNIGYTVSRNNGDDFIIVLNNDVEIDQIDFLDIMFRTFEDKQCYLIGPDIVNIDGIHQSPQRDHFITKRELVQWYYKRLSFLYVLKIVKNSKTLSNMIEKRYRKHDLRRIKAFDSVSPAADVELQGACFIFTPLFVGERNRAFEEISFMYGEEPMMGVLCQKNGWHTYFNPEMKILHKEKSTSRSENTDYIKHEIFYTQNMIEGLRNIIKKYL